ncbi:hypothetical protein EVC45_04870 [Paraburkholderia sp. UYCP14C]|uniref:hypothetical protein n=1 Tax=Paraburkholderia sp. UYCP14C TaxID=2511130 RepID=UPI00101FA191|nr:hypothetical protein [Paraburkholderia sp. UYCP14C]RZF30799.1 hypothetical protein EVC45_04870 [Paraburkholderia sp. UYCP14C]
MKGRLQRIACVLAYISASLIGGWFLGAFISHTSLWIPQWLWNAMRAAVRASDIVAIYDEDDIETLCLFALTITSCGAVALSLGVAWFAVTRYFRMRRV